MRTRRPRKLFGRNNKSVIHQKGSNNTPTCRSTVVDQWDSSKCQLWLQPSLNINFFKVQVWRCLNIVIYLPVYVDKDSAYGVDVSVQGGQLQQGPRELGRDNLQVEYSIQSRWLAGKVSQILNRICSIFSSSLQISASPLKSWRT